MHSFIRGKQRADVTPQEGLKITGSGKTLICIGFESKTSHPKDEKGAYTSEGTSKMISLWKKT